jgi:hypothetical protein
MHTQYDAKAAYIGRLSAPDGSIGAELASLQAVARAKATTKDHKKIYFCHVIVFPTHSRLSR